jgi:DNA-binding NarL/FixJ family response regulator
VVTPPTAREREVLAELALGRTNGEIARTLGISERTVRFHIENLFGRLDVENRVEAVMKAIQLGWLQAP